jgi:hypothetical protein
VTDPKDMPVVIGLGHQGVRTSRYSLQKLHIRGDLPNEMAQWTGPRCTLRFEPGARTDVLAAEEGHPQARYSPPYYP